MPLIPYPNIPRLPGVPALPRLPGAPSVGRVLLGALQGTLWSALQTRNQWGITDSAGRPLASDGLFQGLAGEVLATLGGPVMSTSSVDYSKETVVSDFPVERGGFAAYNKVETPGLASVTLCYSGSEAGRRQVLETIDRATKSTDLYNVATPEVTYIGYAIERYDYQRHSGKGATLLILNLVLKEVRQVSAQFAQVQNAQITAPKSPGAAATTDGGKVQPQAPKQSTLKSLSEKLPALIESLGN